MLLSSFKGELPDGYLYIYRLLNNGNRNSCYRLLMSVCQKLKDHF